MTSQLASLLAAIFLGIAVAAAAEEATRVFPGEHWERREPTKVGLNKDRLEEFARFIGAGTDDPANRNDRRIGCVVRNGYLVHSWGDQAAKFNWYSSSKPAVSTMLFFAVDRGLLPSVDARIAELGWPLIAKDRTMTFAHLANQVSGYALPEPPGAAYAYNDIALQLYVLSLEKVFGRPLNDAAMEYLAPLQFEDGDLFNARRRVRTTPRDFARLGWFWMNRGRWAGRQVLPQAYFDAYMRPGVPPDLPRSKTLSDPNDYLKIGSYGGGFNQGPVGPGMYGFNWWFNGPMGTTGVVPIHEAPRDIVMALGARGCYMIMLPGQRMLVAAQGRWGNVDELDPADRERFNTAMRLLMGAIERPAASEQ